jgi:hypothetical protein
MRNNCFPIFTFATIAVIIIATASSFFFLPAFVHESTGAQKSVTKKVIPFDSDLDNTGCGGEIVRLRGEIHFFTFVVLPDDGGLQRTTDIDVQVIEAVGLKSGNKYHVTKMIINTQSADAGGGGPLGIVENASVSFQLSGPSKGDDLLVRDLRMTVGNGSQFTIDDSNVRIICGKYRII